MDAMAENTQWHGTIMIRSDVLSEKKVSALMKALHKNPDIWKVADAETEEDTDDDSSDTGVDDEDNDDDDGSDTAGARDDSAVHDTPIELGAAHIGSDEEEEQDDDYVCTEDDEEGESDDEDDEEEEEEEDLVCMVADECTDVTKWFKKCQCVFSKALSAWIDNFSYYDDVLTFQTDVTVYKFNEGHHWKPHCEMKPFSEDNCADVAFRKLVFMIFLASADLEGADIALPLQQITLSTSTMKNVMICMPVCPLHPFSISPVTKGELICVCTYMC